MAESGMKPHELLKLGLIDEISMKDYRPDQRMVEEACGYEPQGASPNEGGSGGAAMRYNSSELSGS